MIKLYGTTTSPFVRRVAIVAHELGQKYELIDTNDSENQTRLRAVSPIWKVPVAELASGVVFDSHAIVDELLLAHGHGSLRASNPMTRVSDRNLINAVDGALEGCIRRFYIRRDGTDPDTLPYLKKEGERARAVMAWLEAQLRGEWCSADDGVGLSEIALYTALTWMRFRNAYPVNDHPGLVAFEKAHASRESLLATAPR